MTSILSTFTLDGKTVDILDEIKKKYKIPKSKILRVLIHKINELTEDQLEKLLNIK